MATLNVELVEIIDDNFPVFGAFEFSDKFGEAVVLHEKIVVVGVSFIEGETTLPLKCDLECKIISISGEEAVIDIKEPHGLEDIQGRTQFCVLASALDR